MRAHCELTTRKRRKIETETRRLQHIAQIHRFCLSINERLIVNNAIGLFGARFSCRERLKLFFVRHLSRITAFPGSGDRISDCVHVLEFKRFNLIDLNVFLWFFLAAASVVAVVAANGCGCSLIII